MFGGQPLSKYGHYSTYNALLCDRYDHNYDKTHNLIWDESIGPCLNSDQLLLNEIPYLILSTQSASLFSFKFPR